MPIVQHINIADIFFSALLWWPMMRNADRGDSAELALKGQNLVKK